MCDMVNSLLSKKNYIRFRRILEDKVLNLIFPEC